ncbi:hypothetical protein BaRGS_00003039 [Batillaria attramentaria]|uniref:Nucleoporin SEH1 n=1 Tax=Batillaria attramentaria TaxID=370345 RepID=A0ABD0M320_9CAEN
MFAAKSISADHKDLIHDVSYDFHGRRMATCSSDQTVKVWEQGDDGQWHCTASWKTHSGSVWRVTWAHPEFGQVLATCSFDRTAAVWEKEAGQNHWLKRTSLVDSRTSVTDVKFAPKHLGLQLATLQLSLLEPKQSAPSNVSSGGKVQIHEYSEVQRKWNKVETVVMVAEPVHDVCFAPNMGRSYHLLAIASKELSIISLKPLRKDPAAGGTGISKFEMRQVAVFDEHESQVWRASWNVTGTILASSGADGFVRMWKANYLDNWKCISVLKGDGSTGEGPASIPQNSVTSGAPSSIPPNGAATNGSGSSVVSHEPPARSMNIKRNTGWPWMDIKKDQFKLFY